MDLIEGKPIGVLSLLDEECLFPEGTDASLLSKFQKNFGSHTHFPKLPSSVDKFSILHYAGTVRTERIEQTEA